MYGSLLYGGFLNLKIDRYICMEIFFDESHEGFLNLKICMEIFFDEGFLNLKIYMEKGTKE